MLFLYSKQFLQYERKNYKNFVIISKIMLDIWEEPCYIIQARVGNKYARTAMMREIASKTVTSAEYVRSSGG